jgi:hypothetical protein
LARHVAKPQRAQLGDVGRDPPRFGSSHFPCSRFFRRLSPFPFAGLPVVAGNATLNHLVAPVVAREDESRQVATAKRPPKAATTMNCSNSLIAPVLFKAFRLKFEL